MSTRVEIYTKLYCAYSQRAKELLRIKGIAYVEHDITDATRKAAEIQQRCRLQGVPWIFIDGVPIGGCADLFDLDERGQLDALLAAAAPGANYPPARILPISVTASATLPKGGIR